MKRCDAPLINDLSQGIGPIRHLYCQRCYAHLYKGRQYAAKEWYDWINGPDEPAHPTTHPED